MERFGRGKIITQFGGCHENGPLAMSVFSPQYPFMRVPIKAIGRISDIEEMAKTKFVGSHFEIQNESLVGPTSDLGCIFPLPKIQFEQRLGEKQVWSLSSFEVSHQPLTNDLNQVSSISMLITSSMALANEGLFGLTWHQRSTGIPVPSRYRGSTHVWSRIQYR